MGFSPSRSCAAEPDVYNAITKLKPGQITEIIPVSDDAGPNRKVMGYAIYKLIAASLPGSAN